MRLRVYSDLHLERQAFCPPTVPCDVVVLAGDVQDGVAGVDWARATFPDHPVIYVAGNHEHYGLRRDAVAAGMHACAAGSRVQVLEQEACVVGGVRFLGCTLWSDFELFGDAAASLAEALPRGLDYREISTRDGRFRPRDAVRAHRRAVDWLTAALEEPHDGPTVVVTHHAPSIASLPECYLARPRAAAYASHLDDLVAHSGAALWIHGHVHRRSDYWIGETRVVCNPRGTAEESGFDPHLTIEL